MGHGALVFVVVRERQSAKASIPAAVLKMIWHGEACSRLGLQSPDHAHSRSTSRHRQKWTLPMYRVTQLEKLVVRPGSTYSSHSNPVQAKPRWLMGVRMSTRGLIKLKQPRECRLLVGCTTPEIPSVQLPCFRKHMSDFISLPVVACLLPAVLSSIRHTRFIARQYDMHVHIEYALCGVPPGGCVLAEL